MERTYQRRPGDRGFHAVPVPDRFWPKVDQRGFDECWPWVAGFKRQYGSFRVGTAKVAAHRVAYELIVGPIPAGLTIDHLCRNTACVNPVHLEAVPIAVNILRGNGPAAINARKTHCPKGHPYDAVNTQVNDGSRVCRICSRAAGRAYRARQAALLLAMAP